MEITADSLTWLWIAIGAHTAFQIIFAVILFLMRQEQKDLRNIPEPVDYIQAFDELHVDYIKQVTDILNHEHGVGLTVGDVETSALFHYTTQALVNDTPPEKCASSIVYVLDNLMAKKTCDVVDEIGDDLNNNE